MTLLLIDVGRGTQDILLYEPCTSWENSIQMVLPSPSSLLATRVESATAAGRDILFYGETMGGSPLKKSVQRHLDAGLKVWATPSSAATFDDDPDEVAKRGIVIVDEEKEETCRRRGNTCPLFTADVDLKGLSASLRAWGIESPVDAAAVAVQDHGKAPRGESDRLFRFEMFREMLARAESLTDLAYTPGNLPGCFTRMQAAARLLGECRSVLLMDTGFAALAGVLDDPHVARGKRRLLVNVGNGHTLAGLLEGEKILGLIEHHTGRLDGESLFRWLDVLVKGEVRGEDVYRDGGHGAFLREGSVPGGWGGVDVFAVTGPRRSLTEGMEKVPYLAAPHGQMMLTGNYGLYRAFRSLCGEYG